MTAGERVGNAVGALLIPVALAAFTPPSLLGQKTDVLTLYNGDVVTGEIRELYHGKLAYKTDDMGTLSVEWDKIARLRSTRLYEVILSNGRRVFGSIREADQDGQMVVLGDTLRLLRVGEITPIESGFFARTNGRISLGSTLAQANDAKTITFDWEANYRGEVWGTSIKGSSYYQKQSNADPTSRHNGSVSGLRFINGRWAGLVTVDLTSNDQLNLALRTSVGGGAQVRPLLTNQMELKLLAGLLLSSERFKEDDSSTKSVELALSGDWDWFRYDSPKLDLGVQATPIFSLTKLGRVRLEFSTVVTYEVLSDFNVGVNLRDSFDSNPPQEGAAKNDFTIGLTLGWSWS